jgi:pimeloyl-ACP methyl ester carboxylesterase
LLIWVVFTYAKVARFRYRREPETLNHIDEFIERRADDLDRRAVEQRLHLIAESDFRSVAIKTKVPIYAIAGILDPIVPWPWVRRWLSKNCPSLKEYKIIQPADHNVLATASRIAAEQVLRWIDDL